MSGSREQILGRIRKAVSALPNPAPLPEYDPALSVSRIGVQALGAPDLLAVFAEQLQAASGRWAEDWSQLADRLRKEEPACGYCAPEFVEKLKMAWPEAPVEETFSRGRIDDYAFGITPAWGAIAETGTVLLLDSVTPARLAALAPWIHVAVVPAERLFATVADAIAALPDDPSIVMVTGPSKTADIEGILIEGVHGPGQQYAIVERSR